MKSTIRIEYLQPTAVSAIDGSHIHMVTQIVWINPFWEVFVYIHCSSCIILCLIMSNHVFSISYQINATGQFIACEEGRQSLQAVSSSIDGSILFWNMDPNAANIPGVTRKRRSSKRPTGLKTEKSPFSSFNRKLKPVFRVCKYTKHKKMD